MYAGGNVLLRTGLENPRPHPGREVPTSTTSWLEQNPWNYVILLSLSFYEGSHSNKQINNNLAKVAKKVKNVINAKAIKGQF